MGDTAKDNVSNVPNHIRDFEVARAFMAQYHRVAKSGLAQNQTKLTQTLFLSQPLEQACQLQVSLSLTDCTNIPNFHELARALGEHGKCIDDVTIECHPPFAQPRLIVSLENS